jgi:hypothetical protein
MDFAKKVVTWEVVKKILVTTKTYLLFLVSTELYIDTMFSSWFDSSSYFYSFLAHFFYYSCHTQNIFPLPNNLHKGNILITHLISPNHITPKRNGPIFLGVYPTRPPHLTLVEKCSQETLYQWCLHVEILPTPQIFYQWSVAQKSHTTTMRNPPLQHAKNTSCVELSPPI